MLEGNSWNGGGGKGWGGGKSWGNGGSSKGWNGGAALAHARSNSEVTRLKQKSTPCSTGGKGWGGGGGSPGVWNQTLKWNMGKAGVFNASIL